MEELLIIERKMISAKYSGKKLKYWYYKRKYEKMKKKLNNKYFIKK